MNAEKDSLLVARFLIEDNNSEYVELDLDANNDIPVVISIFKTLIGTYSLLDEQEENVLKAQTQKVNYLYKNKYINIFF